MGGTDTFSARPRYHALVLGPFEVERDGKSLHAGQWQRRVQTLFKLLVTVPGRQRRRDDLIELLWPESDPDTSAGNLRLLVHRLRLTLGGDPSSVLSHNNWVALNPAYEWTLDLEEIEAIAGDAHGDIDRLEAAVAMVRGEPFADDRYDDWAVPLTARALRVWRDACLQLGAIYRARGHNDEAARWYERVLETDPLDEEAVRGVLAVTARAGRVDAALRRYESFRAKLADELDARPTTETETLVEQIHARAETDGDEEAIPSGGFLGAEPEGPLIGRADELESVLLLADAAESGGGRLVMISGEVGIGKTRLAQEVMMRLRDRGFLIATTRCYSPDRAVPFAPFLDLLSRIHAAVSPSVAEEATQRWPHLALLLPHGDTFPSHLIPESPNDRHTLFRACAAFLGRLAQRRPLALLVDDLHGADDASLDLLAYLARQTRGHRIFLLATYRDGDISRDHPLSRVMRDMVREGVVDRLTLGRLDRNETAALVTGHMHAGETPTDFSEFVWRRTRGNPLYVNKMIHALDGRYRLVSQVGAGSMGRVFEAIDDRSGGQVAIKLMFARTEVDPKALLRFRQEGVVLAGLHHPNIVHVHGTFVEEYASCIAMELLDGRSLTGLLANGPLPLGQAKNLALQILAALGAAHEHGIVHRDVKPANVMVLDGDRVKVTDFGIARLARSGSDTNLTSTGLTLGTPLYMAPEQVQGGIVDARTDLYAVGVVLYQMVTGKPPFYADDPLAVAFMHVNDAPVPTRALRPGIPDEWDAVILRVLAKSPGDRFQSAVALERALAALPETETHPAARELPAMESPVLPPAALSSTGTTMRWRRPISAVLASGVLLLAGAFLLRLHAVARASVSPLLHGPASIAVDPGGNVYVSDQGNNRVVVFSPSGIAIHSWGTMGFGTMQFDSPGDLALAPDGTLDVVDLRNHRVDVLRDGRQVDTEQVDGGTVNVGSLALGPAGQLFASAFGRNQILALGPAWQVLRLLPVPGIDVGAQPYPAGMAVDRQGNLYVADRYHSQIVKLSPTGTVLARFGRYGTARPTAGGEPLFNMPSDVVLDAAGRIYVADTYNNRVEILSPTGRVLRVIPGISPHHPRFDHINSLAVDAQDDIYIAEYFQNQILKLRPNGTIVWASPAS